MAIPLEINDLDSHTREISASAATIYAYRIRNRNAYPIYVKFYNKLAANVAATTDTPALTVTVAASDEATDDTEHAFATALSVRCTTHAGNYDTNPPAVSPEIELQLAASGGGASEVQPGTSVIQAALDAASAGDTVVLAAGTFVEDAGIEIPDNVHLRGKGQGISIIESSLNGLTAPFHGIVAPGNNSVISDLSIIAVSPTDTGDEHINPISKRAGSTKSWTNVTVERCHLYGLADVVFANGGQSLGDMTFIDCLIEGRNDLFMWQSASNAVLVNCVLRHTVYTDAGLSAVGLYDGGSGGTIKAYGCRYEYVGGDGSGQAFPIAAQSHVEVYDFVIDYTNGSPSASSKDISNWDGTPGVDVAFISNVRRADGLPISMDGVVTNLDRALCSAVTVANLPADPVVGQLATVSNGSGTPAWGDTVAGGGSLKLLVMWNGANWTVVGK